MQPDIGKLMEMLRNPEAMKKRIEEAQKKIEMITATGSAGGGMVTTTVNGKFEIVDIVISKEVVDPDDIPMLQDLVRASANDAVGRVRDLISSEAMSMGEPDSPFPTA